MEHLRTRKDFYLVSLADEKRFSALTSPKLSTTPATPTYLYYAKIKTMDENIKQQNFSANENKPKPASPPPPPPPEIGIRTMQSDVESIKQSGGEAPTPQTFVPQELKPETPKPPAEEPKIEAPLNIPGYTGPEKPIFTPQPSVPTSQPASPTPPVQPPIQPTPSPAQTPAPQSIPTISEQTAPSKQPQQPAKESSTLKTIILIIGIVAAVIGLGLLGYYVISPLLF
ncbi:MAG TPA: hypothetical protein ENH26_02370 [Candidatus Wolfebacteria bacterium]|nr:hypothetical protein [Candidatus Wolfebacteria bacterium]